MPADPDPARADHTTASGALGEQAERNHLQSEQSMADLGATFVTAVHELRDAVQEQNERGMQARRRYAQASVAAGLVIILVVFGNVLIGVESVSTSRAVKSCVTVGDPCYRRNANSDESTRQYLVQQGQLRLAIANQASIAAASCAQKVTGYDAIMACVQATLKAQGMPTPSPAASDPDHP